MSLFPLSSPPAPAKPAPQRSGDLARRPAAPAPTFQRRADAGEVYAAQLATARGADRSAALKRLAGEIRACRGLGCALGFGFAGDPDVDGQRVFSLILPDQAAEDRLHECLMGAD